METRANVWTDPVRMESLVNFGKKKVTQVFNTRQGRDLNLEPRGWKAEILPLRQPCHRGYRCSKFKLKSDSIISIVPYKILSLEHTT